jgi:nucleotide-binding universal stress UspA family protein
MKKILLPIDGSEYSFKAAKYAIKIAKSEKGELFCIHVITPRIPYGYATSAVSAVHEGIKPNVESWFDKVKKMARDEDIHDVKTEIFIDVKSVIQSVVEYASSNDMDLIVIGTRGRTGLKRLLMGSVANGVARHAHCSVLLVR